VVEIVTVPQAAEEPNMPAGADVKDVTLTMELDENKIDSRDDVFKNNPTQVPNVSDDHAHGKSGNEAGKSQKETDKPASGKKSPEPPPNPTFECRRNVTAFEAILDFVQNDELHAPSQLCPRQFIRELDFWGISPHSLHSCCYTTIATFLNDEYMVSEFRKKLDEFKHANLKVHSGSMSSHRLDRPLRDCFWELTVDPFYDLPSKVGSRTFTFTVTSTLRTPIPTSTPKSLRRR
jgi:hypothetical protein